MGWWKKKTSNMSAVEMRLQCIYALFDLYDVKVDKGNDGPIGILMRKLSRLKNRVLQDHGACLNWYCEVAEINYMGKTFVSVFSEARGHRTAEDIQRKMLEVFATRNEYPESTTI